MQRVTGNAEATVFKILDKAVKNVIDANLLTMLAGNTIVVGATSVPLDSTTDPTTPTYTFTMAQMVAMGYLPAGWTTTSSSINGGVYRMRITRLPVGCVFPNCTLEGMTWLDKPILLNNKAGTINGKIVGAMFASLGADSGISQIGTGGTIAGFGNTWSHTNPVAGTPPGIFAMRTVGLYQPNFVRIQDPRDPDLQGNLTIAGNEKVGGTMQVNGNTTLNGDLTVNGPNGASIGPCIQMGGIQGRAGFGCTNKDDVPAGYTGGVRSPDVVANGNVLASNAPGGFTGSNGNYALLTSNNGTGEAEIRTSGRAAGDRLTPIGSYVAGSACPATEEGSIAKNATTTGLVVCEAGVWSPMQTRGTVGQPCAPSGVMGVSAAGLALYCQSNVWTLMADRFGRFAMTDTYLVYDNSRGLNPPIPIPNCPAGGVPKIYFNPQGIDTRTGTKTANFRADISMNPGYYTILVDDSLNPNDPSGTATSGYGLLTVGCFYN